ncbi:MAG: 5-(carboxyamino)imidazole ribonucleotide mutase [Verrucomicrobiota bacterium]
MGSQNKPKVAVIMGSSSDYETMENAVQILEQFGIECKTRVISAHRTPQVASEFADQAYENGFRVIIAGAGKAAHLAGVIAAHTTIPIIGVPMKTSDLGGLDSLLSTVQMPGGVPVATTAIGKAGAKNAGLLAVQILSIADSSLVDKLAEYRQQMTEEVETADRDIRNR